HLGRIICRAPQPSNHQGPPVRVAHRSSHREDRTTFNVPLPQANGGANPTRPPKVFKVKITLAATINPELLNRFVHGQQSHDDEATTAITACNVALRMEPNMNFPFNTRSFFIEGLEKRAIGAGLELWRGLFQSFRPGPEKVFINVDIATGLMYRQGPLIGLCLEVIGQSNPNYLSPQQGLPDHIRMKLERFIKGVQVIVEGTHQSGCPCPLRNTSSRNSGVHLPTPTYCVPRWKDCDGPAGGLHGALWTDRPEADPPSQDERRPHLLQEDPRRTIRDHPTRHSGELSALWLWYRNLTGRVVSGIRSISIPLCPRINVNTSRGPMEVNGRVLNAPKMIYGQNVQVPLRVAYGAHRLSFQGPRNGAWNMAQKKLWRPCAPIREWIVVVYENQNRFNNDRVQGMVQGLVTEARNVGITFSSNTPLVRYENGNGNIGEKKVGPTLYVVVLPENGDEIYTAVKHFGDVTQGVATQCLKSNKCARANAQYWANVLLKVNVKLGGVNSIPDPALASSLADPAIPTIVMGADVIHPAPGADGRPSFTALVSSVDRHCAKYIATDRVQEGRREIISDLKEMAVHCLNNYVNYSASRGEGTEIEASEVDLLPSVALQMVFPKANSQVIEQELTLLKKALDECDMKAAKLPLLSSASGTIFGQFKPVNDADKDRSGNAPAGLVVDRDIGHPIEFDFYLQSHGGLLGRAGRRITRFCTMRTCSSAHYFCPSLFEAGIDSYVHHFAVPMPFKPSRFRFATSTPATRSVSIPAPVYYADIVCARAKTHYDPNQGGLFSDSGTVTSQGAAQNLQAFRAHFKPLSDEVSFHPKAPANPIQLDAASSRAQSSNLPGLSYLNNQPLFTLPPSISSFILTPTNLESSFHFTHTPPRFTSLVSISHVYY
ncbi:hypothetical protein FA13DRAFT_1907530, partial [Coprinellus micaceus]